MFENFNEKEKKKFYSLLILMAICVCSLIAISGVETTQEVKSVDNEQNNQNQEIENKEPKNELEEKLKNILSQIKGAGDLDVMITLESSEEIQPAFNTNTTVEETSEKDPQGGERVVKTSNENKTMITSNSNNPVIIKTNEAKIKGVIVVSTGANDPIVKESLYKAVQTALQIEGYQVEVFSK